MKRTLFIILLLVVAGLGFLFTQGYFDGDTLDPLPDERTEKIDVPDESNDGLDSGEEEGDSDGGDGDEAPIDREHGRDIEGRIAIIIDDLGYSSEMDIKLSEIEHNLTLAVLPFLEGTSNAVDRFKDVNNFELILHLPLEPMSADAHEEHMMMVDMERNEIVDLLERAVDDIGVNVRGLNNHKGSRFTQDGGSMEILLTEVKERGLFFVDSYTIGSSVGYEMSSQMEIPTARRDVFLDNVDDRDSIKAKLRELEEIAGNRGSAIGIGHHKDITLEVLKEEMPEMERRGIEFVFVSQLLE